MDGTRQGIIVCCVAFGVRRLLLTATERTQVHCCKVCTTCINIHVRPSREVGLDHVVCKDVADSMGKKHVLLCIFCRRFSVRLNRAGG